MTRRSNCQTGLQAGRESADLHSPARPGIMGPVGLADSASCTLPGRRLLMSGRATRVVAVLVLLGLVAGPAWLVPATAQASPALILNEYNAVGGEKWIDGDKSSKSDTYFGRVMGNGDNWLELVVVENVADLRGYELLWWEDDGDGNGTDVWDPARVADNASQGKIVFSDVPLWSNLRAGTIITISDKQTVNTTDGYTGLPVSFDLSTDTSYNPAAGDWWIHVSSRQEAVEAIPLVTTLTNVTADPAGAFSVGNNDWELRITDGTTTVFGPVGEAIEYWDGGGINSEEVGKVEADPSASITISAFRDGTSSTFGSPNVWSSGAHTQDFSALRVPEPAAAVMLVSLAAAIGLVRRRG